MVSYPLPHILRYQLGKTLFTVPCLSTQKVIFKGYVRFAVLQLISAVWIELGLIRDQSAQTAARAVGIA